MSCLFHARVLCPVALLASAMLSACSSTEPEAPAIQVVKTPTFDAKVQPDGRMSLSAPHASWSTTLELVGWGRAGAVEAVGEPTLVEETAGRTNIERSGIVEWYQPAERGMEHGFDIAAPPSGSGDIQIQLALDTSLEPWVTADAVRFRDATGRTRLYYDTLEVYDADGTVLPSSMDVECEAGCVLTLSFDGRDAVWPVVVDPLVYVAEDIYQPSVLQRGAQSGTAMAVDGDLAVVGMARWDSAIGDRVGLVDIYERSGGTWSVVDTLFPTNLGKDDQFFGSSVDIDGDTVIVGAPGDGINESGEAFVFRESAGTWTLEDSFDDPMGEDGDQFGSGVAIDGDIAVVGATTDDVNATRSGSVWIYERTGTTWDTGQQVFDDDAGANDRLGVDVDIEGSVVVAGAWGYEVGGAVAVIRDSQSGWYIDEYLEEDVPEGGSRLGTSVAIFGNRIAAGAPRANTTFGNQGGRAVVWVDDGGGYAMEAQLVPSYGSSSGRFGLSIAMREDALIVGSPDYDSPSGNKVGDAVVFDYDDTAPGAWAERQHLIETFDGNPSISLSATDKFGAAVAIGEDFALAGIPQTNAFGLGNTGGFWSFDGFEADQDNDGFFSETFGGEDCDDNEPTANPDGVEVEDNGIDEDCDGLDAFCGTDITTTPDCDIRVVITEIMANPVNADESAGEWIEVRNRGLDRIDLRGSLIISDVSTHQISNYVVLAPGERGVLGASGDVGSNGGIVPDYVYSGLSLGDSSGGLGVRIRASNLVADLDIVAYDATFSSGTAAPDGASFSVDPYHARATENDLAVRWCDSYTPFGDGDFGTPGEPNDECNPQFDVDYQYIGLPPNTDVLGTTLVRFEIDAAFRYFQTGNSGEGTWTRTTTSAGQTTTWAYDDYLNGDPGVTYTGFKAFGQPCTPGGTISNLPFGYVSGTWSDPACP